jgi:glyoxylate reductase
VQLPKKIFVSFIISEITVVLLKQAGFEVDFWPHKVTIPQDEFINSVKASHAIVTTGSEPMDAHFFDACSHLEIISQCAAGYDNIDINKATALGIPVCNAADPTTEATAEIAFGLMIATARKMFFHHKNILKGGWSKMGRPSDLGIDLSGKTLGIFGLGRIGAAMARKCKAAYHMDIIYHNRTRNYVAEKELGAKYVDFDTLQRESDVLSVHCSLNETTRGIFNHEVFNSMKLSSIFINTSRGGVHNQKDLTDALKDRVIWGAGLDVTDPEPMDSSHPLLQMDTVAILPHIGSATFEAREAMARTGAENIVNFYSKNQLPNLINPGFIKK